MFFKKTDKKEENNFILKVCALLIHAAKIDENYTDKEEEIIKKTLLELGLENEKIIKTIQDAKIIEENSNQILDFTREIKNLPEKDKIKIVEALWSIIYSNEDADMYELSELLATIFQNLLWEWRPFLKIGRAKAFEGTASVSEAAAIKVSKGELVVEKQKFPPNLTVAIARKIDWNEDYY